MPKRTDIKKILIIGSGPIVIGQACEFDYSGTQACKVLREEGYEVVLVNSNPATIMTDPEFSDRTYIEPLLPEFVEKIVEKEKELQELEVELGGAERKYNQLIEDQKNQLENRFCAHVILLVRSLERVRDKLIEYYQLRFRLYV